MSNEDECIENVMVKMVRSQKNLAIPLHPKAPSSPDDKLLMAYHELQQRHNELVDYIAKMSQRQISESFLDCIKNDNVTLFKVNQELRLVVKDLCLKINDLKKEGKRPESGQVCPNGESYIRSEKQKRTERDQTRIIELKNQEIDSLSQRISTYEASKAELERQLREITQSSKNRVDSKTEDALKSLRQVTIELQESQAMRKNLETLNQQKTAEMASFGEKISALQAQLLERQHDVSVVHEKLNQMAQENESLKRALYEQQSRDFFGGKETVEREMVQQELNGARKNLQKEKEKVQGLTQDLETLRTENAQIRSEVQLLYSQQDSLNSQKTALEERLLRMEHGGHIQVTPSWQTQGNISEVEELRQRNIMLQRDLEAASQMAHNLSNKVSELQVLLENAKRDLRDRPASVTRSYLPRPSISPRPGPGHTVFHFQGETDKDVRIRNSNGRGMEPTVLSVQYNNEFLTKELEKLKIENERLKQQINEITDINHRNVEEIKRLMRRVNEQTLREVNLELNR